MTAIGTTGTRAIAQDYEPVLVDWLIKKDELFGQYSTFVSGACIGWDAVWGSTMALEYPERDHLVIVPADRSRVEEWWHAIIEVCGANIRFIYMPEGSSYKERNIEIVRHSNDLFYCADYPEAHGKSQRSGTWQTVRLARAVGIEPIGMVINERNSNE